MAGWLKSSASAYSAPISVHAPLPSPSVASNSKHASCRSARCDPSTRRTALGLVASSGGAVLDWSARRGLDGSASGERYRARARCERRRRERPLGLQRGRRRRVLGVGGDVEGDRRRGPRRGGGGGEERGHQRWSDGHDRFPASALRRRASSWRCGSRRRSRWRRRRALAAASRSSYFLATPPPIIGGVLPSSKSTCPCRATGSSRTCLRTGQDVARETAGGGGERVWRRRRRRALEPTTTKMKKPIMSGPSGSLPFRRCGGRCGRVSAVRRRRSKENRLPRRRRCTPPATGLRWCRAS